MIVTLDHATILRPHTRKYIALRLNALRRKFPVPGFNAFTLSVVSTPIIYAITSAASSPNRARTN